MGEKQDELEMLQEEYTIETTQLKELEEKLEVRMVSCRGALVWGMAPPPHV
jgi:hypothetical protein